MDAERGVRDGHGSTHGWMGTRRLQVQGGGGGGMGSRRKEGKCCNTRPSKHVKKFPKGTHTHRVTGWTRRQEEGGRLQTSLVADPQQTHKARAWQKSARGANGLEQH